MMLLTSIISLWFTALHSLFIFGVYGLLAMKYITRSVFEQTNIISQDTRKWWRGVLCLGCMYICYNTFVSDSVVASFIGIGIVVVLLLIKRSAIPSSAPAATTMHGPFYDGNVYRNDNDDDSKYWDHVYSDNILNAFTNIIATPQTVSSSSPTLSSSMNDRGNTLIRPTLQILFAAHEFLEYALLCHSHLGEPEQISATAHGLIEFTWNNRRVTVVGPGCVIPSWEPCSKVREEWDDVLYTLAIHRVGHEHQDK